MKNEGFKFSVDDTNDYKKGGIEKVIESLGVEYLQIQAEKLTQENNDLESIYDKFFSCIEVVKENGDDNK